MTHFNKASHNGSYTQAEAGYTFSVGGYEFETWKIGGSKWSVQSLPSDDERLGSAGLHYFDEGFATRDDAARQAEIMVERREALVKARVEQIFGAWGEAVYVEAQATALGWSATKLTGHMRRVEGQPEIVEIGTTQINVSRIAEIHQGVVTCECDRWMERQEQGLPGRCDKHAAMMRAIRETLAASTDQALCRRIYLTSDGFGAGTNPEATGWDWSGIRDSTPAAVEAMFALLPGPVQTDGLPAAGQEPSAKLEGHVRDALEAIDRGDFGAAVPKLRTATNEADALAYKNKQGRYAHLALAKPILSGPLAGHPDFDAPTGAGDSVEAERG